MSLSLISGGTVSTSTPPVRLPSGNADTITNALGPFFNQAERDLIHGAAETGFFSYNEPSCAGAGVNGGPGLGSQLGASVAGSALNAVPVVGPVLSKIFSAINPIAHHAAAVRTEQATLCRAVPDANNFLRGIDTAVATGQIDVATAAQALEQGFQNWMQEVRAIYKTGAGKNCNAACVYGKAFRAAIEKRKLDYSIATAQNVAGSQGVFGGVVSAIKSVGSSFLSDVLPQAAGGGSSFAVSSLPSSSGSLAKAGLTPARQSALAGFLLVGGLLVSIALFSKFFAGGK